MAYEVFGIFFITKPQDFYEKIKKKRKKSIYIYIRNATEKRSGEANEVIDIQSIREKVKKGKYRISFTHTEKLRERKIEIGEIEEAVSGGEIIEEYPDDPRGPSCLIFGFTHQGRSMHIVCGDLEDERILVITAYEPSLEEWEEDWKSRR